MSRPFNASSDQHNPSSDQHNPSPCHAYQHNPYFLRYPSFFQHDPYGASSLVYDPSSYQHNPYFYQYYASSYLYDPYPRFYTYPYDPSFYPYPYDPSSNTYSGFVVNNQTPPTTPIQPYLAERLVYKKLEFGRKVVYVDLQRNRRGIFFHIKDISSNDYILLDLSGLEQFLTNLYDSMLSITTHFHDHEEFLLEERTMEDDKKNYTFTPFREDDGNLTLRIRVVEGGHDHTINIPANFSTEYGCAGWWLFSENLLNVLMESGMNSGLDFGNIIEKQQQLQGELRNLLHNQIDEQAPQMAVSMQEFSKEMIKAGIIEEMVNDAVDSALDSEDIEDEIGEEVDKVLTAIAGETAAQLPEAVRKERVKQPAQVVAAAEEEEAIAEGADDDEELEEIRARLAKVRS